MPGREQRAGPGLPGGPPPGGPDGRVQALLAERPHDHGEGHGRVPVVVDGGDHPRRPADQPRLDARGHQQRHRPGRVGRGFEQSGLVREPGGQLDQLGIWPGWPGVGDVDGAHGSSFVRSRPAHGSAAAPGGEKDSRTGPGGRLASTGGRSRAPGPGTRAGPLQPRGEAGVAAQGGVPVRHGNAEGAVPPVACQANGRSAGAFIRSQPTRAAVVAGSARSVGVVRLSFSRLWCLRPPCCTAFWYPTSA
jgi:hypothetical protein